MTNSEDIQDISNIYAPKSSSELYAVQGCYLDPEKGTWVPEFNAKKYKSVTKCKKLVWTYFLIQPATSGASKCRICGFKIEKQALRIGRPIKDPRGEWGTISSWQHLSCSRKLLHKAYSNSFLSDQENNDKDKQNNPVVEEYIPSTTDLEFDPDNRKSPNSNFSLFSQTILSPPQIKVLDQYVKDIPKSFNLRKLIHGIDDLTEEQIQQISTLTEPPSYKEIEMEAAQYQDIKDLVKKRFDKELKPPADVLVPLLNFQQEGLAWMCQQEESDIKGGILADEMGMGKTLQMICLFLTRKLKSITLSNKLIGGNLVIAPLAAILQWKQEIERFTKFKSLDVLIYHGNYRDSIFSELTKYDVIITTYSTLEADYRRVINKHKVKCQYCNRLFLPDKLRFHQTYFCGPKAEKTEKQNLQKAKSRNAAKKAMQTLNIGSNNSFPNPSNVYRELLSEANSHNQTSQEATQADSFNDISDKDKEFILKQISSLGSRSLEHIFKLKELRGYQKETVKKFIETKLATEANHQDAVNESHSISRTDIKKLKIEELRKKLKEHGLSTEGLKLDLINRLISYFYSEQKINTTFPHDTIDLSISNPPRRSFKRTKTSHNNIFSSSRGSSNTNENDAIKTEIRDSIKIIDVDSDSSYQLKSSSKIKQALRNYAKSSQDEIKIYPSNKSASRALKRPKTFRSNNNKGSTFDSESYDDSDDEEYVEEILSSSTDYTTSNSSDQEYTSDSAKSLRPASTAQKKKAKKYKSEAKRAQVSKHISEGPINPELLSLSHIELSSSPLHSIEWQRIVLDEAHRIKSRTTSTAQAVYSLKSCGTKWCLTGTPIQNRVGELYSLVRFIEFDPFAFFYCTKRDCNCKSLNFRFSDNRFCVTCGHARLSHYSYFNRKIVNPIKHYGYQGEGRNSLISLKSEVLDMILLRRTKEERAADVKLPKLTVKIRKDSLSMEERNFYEGLYKQSKIEFDTYIEAGTFLHNFAHIFELLSRLRQAVDHPYLISHKFRDHSKSSDPELTFCGLCQELAYIHESVKTRCSHSFHKVCLEEYVDAAPGNLENQELGCPICYKPLTMDLKNIKHPDSPNSNEEEEAELDEALKKIDTLQYKTKVKSIMENIDPNKFKSSTKIEALFEELKRLQITDSSSKSIVFSQYSFMLEIIEWRLKRGGINCAKFVGSMSLVSRSNILYAFNQDPDLKVLLISLKAGGEGLNLQIANNIFLMDPWWNPASEMQAIQRAHRLGQKRAVQAIRFISKDTIEEKILQLQEKKQLVFDGTVGAQSSAIMKLTSEDMKFLFQN